MGMLIPPDRILGGSAELQGLNPQTSPKPQTSENGKLFSKSTGGRTQPDLTIAAKHDPNWHETLHSL